MKNRSHVLAFCTLLAFSIAGCGGVEESSRDAQTAEPSTENQPAAAPSEGTQGQEPQGEGEVQAQGKRCYAACSVVSVGASSCPASIGGTGSTSLFGGCNKACNKAEGDAASKLPAGCVINVCSFSGC